MICEEGLGVVFKVVVDEDCCCMIQNCFFIDIIEILTAIFSSVSVNVMERYFSLWSCSSLFGICVCRLFDCSEPWFHSHKLIAFILGLEKLDFFFLRFSFLHNFHRNINILIKVIKTIRLITLFFFIQCFHFLIIFPHYYCLVFTTC